MVERGGEWDTKDSDLKRELCMDAAKHFFL